MQASAARPGAEPAQVVLHVCLGRVQELEVFVAEGVAVSLPDLADPEIDTVG